MTEQQIIVIGVIGLVGVGVYGLLISRNLIKVIVALQIVVKGAMLALIAAGLHSGRVNLGQSLAVTIIVADTVVAVIGLALAIQIKRRVGTLDVNDLATLKK
ncbi:NADH-quinone oxidoreductase subunit K [uncultured bacterium]|nr:NADH-quinone oxidoreductase subunit K [uncultured bacterium]